MVSYDVTSAESLATFRRLLKIHLFRYLPYLNLDQMAALGHTWTPFCFVVRQYFGFFPGQVYLSEVSFDDVRTVLPWSYWFSLVTSQFPVCCPTSCSGVVHSQDVKSEPYFFNYIFQFPWTSFLSDVFISDLVPPCDVTITWRDYHIVFSGTYGELLLIFSFVWQIVAIILRHTVRLRRQLTHKAWFSPQGWYSYTFPDVY